MLAEAGNDGHLLGVLAHGIKLVGKGSLQLLARDVRQLRLGDKRLGLGAHQLLLQHDDARRVGLLVFELGDLIRDLLFTIATGLHRGLDVADALDRDAVLVVPVDVLVLELANLVDEHAELVRDIRDIIVASLAPER